MNYFTFLTSRYKKILIKHQLRVYFNHVFWQRDGVLVVFFHLAYFCPLGWDMTSQTFKGLKRMASVLSLLNERACQSTSL